MSKYLTYEERLDIQACLKENLSFGSIAQRLKKDRTTIAKEIKKHAIEIKTGCSGWPYNACKGRSGCKQKRICKKEDCPHPSAQYCKLCRNCNDKCLDFEEEISSSQFKPPYVCNACGQLTKCTLRKTMYYAEDAQSTFKETISESRSGILSSEAELARLNTLISPLTKQGQSIHQIYVNHVDKLMCSEKTLYNYIDACLFDVRNIDLPRKVKYRPRYKKPEFKVDKGCRVNRNYKDFQAFMEKHPELSVVQMDSVIGSKGGKVLLTLHFVDTSLMLAFLRDSNTSQSVIDVFQHIYKAIGKEEFKNLFPVILTDNGSEFSNPKAIEFGPDGLRRTNIFYCDPSSPYQKGSIEVNHELVRRIVPKGTHFESLTQNDICLMMNHVNSYKRKKLNNKSPYEAFSFYYGEDLLHRLNCFSVAAEKIILKPVLLKQ
ncbi:IS30 family transposase [Clostridium folliculivorans]|uniref:IS30 family transposase n=1 Tax=Clostridium folliculivorans TaxID=2886038 RepID=UPI0021C3CD0E|nr:IS30 family transposase [Clostridium folliculivorans]GKU32081.1 IS30 family transposase [Clostridium folliculivorans]